MTVRQLCEEIDHCNVELARHVSLGRKALRAGDTLMVEYHGMMTERMQNAKETLAAARYSLTHQHMSVNDA